MKIGSKALSQAVLVNKELLFGLNPPLMGPKRLYFLIHITAFEIFRLFTSDPTSPPGDTNLIKHLILDGQFSSFCFLFL